MMWLIWLSAILALKTIKNIDIELKFTLASTKLWIPRPSSPPPFLYFHYFLPFYQISVITNNCNVVNFIVGSFGHLLLTWN